jgi:hypothetical protein
MNATKITGNAFLVNLYPGYSVAVKAVGKTMVHERRFDTKAEATILERSTRRGGRSRRLPRSSCSGRPRKAAREAAPARAAYKCRRNSGSNSLARLRTILLYPAAHRRDAMEKKLIAFLNNGPRSFANAAFEIGRGRKGRLDLKVLVGELVRDGKLVASTVDGNIWIELA